MTPVSVKQGAGPVVLGMPHGGTFIPDDIFARLNARGQGLDDTDWHIDKLYEDLLPEVTIVKAHVHRYVIDANRDPAGISLYPGQNTTSLCPTTDFDGRDIWLEGQAPTVDEIAQRQATFHAPYHAALAGELARVRDRHGVAVLYDCHSIRSEIPFLFDGQLPLYNIGDNDSLTCARVLTEGISRICQAEDPSDVVVNGRFKGGWTTRHYGRPQDGYHAVQMELAQRGYMDEHPPWGFRPDRAAVVRPILAAVLHGLDDLARSGALTQQTGDRDA